MLSSTLDTSSPRPVRGEFSFLWLELTGRCNLECIHCYAESGPSGTHGLMTTADWQNVIRDAQTLGTATVQFIGGEPTVHPNFLELLSLAGELGLGIEVYTNLLHVTPEMWEAFQAYHVSVATSFYSARPEVHDQVTTRRGSQQRTLANIRKAVAHALPLRVGIIDILPTQDVDRTEGMLRAEGVTDIGVDLVRGVGRGNPNGSSPSIDSLCGNCANGSAAVDPQGWVYPCVFSRWLPIGNVLTDTLPSILASDCTSKVRAELDTEFSKRWEQVDENMTFPPVPCPPNTGFCNPRIMCRPQTEGGTCRPSLCLPTVPRCSPDFTRR